MNNTYCIFKHGINPYTESINLFSDIFANRKITKYKNHYIVISGDIYNIKDIKKEFFLEADIPEEIILELFFKVGINIPSYLRGIFSAVIISNEKIVFFRDYFSVDCIYYYIDNQQNEFIITNKISEIKRFMKLKVDTTVLPRYFVRTSIRKGDTFFENIKTLEFAQLLTLALDDYKLTPTLYDDSLFKEIKNNQLKENIINDKAENIIWENLKEITNYYVDYNVVNSLSGGVDSSYLQILLKKLGFSKAYTFSEAVIGTLIQKYSIDIAKYLEIEHNIIEIKPEYILDNIKEGILTCEAPHIFEGEFLQNYMWKNIRAKEGKKTLVINGQGSDGIFGYGRALLILKYLSKPLWLALFNIINEIIIKLLNKYDYIMYKTIIKKLKKRELDEELLYVLFDKWRYDEDIENTIKKAFDLDNLHKVYSPDIGILNKFEINFVEKLFRWRIDHEFDRAVRITHENCKNYELSICFPYVNKKLLLYACSIPLAKKVKRFKFKIIMKKILSRYLPSKYVYRKKLTQTTKPHGWWLYFFNDEKISKIIKDIKNTKYDYFNFDYEVIFSDIKYYFLANKLINFYIWHKIFIQNVDIKDI